MHEEAQGVDQPAQYQMVAAQQVKGHLRPSRKVIHFSFKMFCCTLKHKNSVELLNLNKITYILVITPEQRKEEVSSHRGITVRGGLSWRLCGTL